MNEIFEKPCIFITSAGRTGTHFLGVNLMHMIEDCTSVHEPDVFYFDSRLFEKIKEFGFFNMTVGKFSHRHSVRGLNIARQRGSLSDDEIVKQIRCLRANTFQNLKTSAYLESNCSWNSLIDLLHEVFSNNRIAYIIRDPRTWVRSWLANAGERYTLFDVRSWFKNARLTPYHFKDDPYQNRWEKMVVFEKLCWVWGKENSYAVKCVEKTDSVKIFRFEDLFDEATNYEAMARLLEFITVFPDGFKARWTLKPEVMRQRIEFPSRKSFPEWTEWSDERASILDEHCGTLMEQFGYGKEPEWQAKLS